MLRKSTKQLFRGWQRNFSNLHLKVSLKNASKVASSHSRLLSSASTDQPFEYYKDGVYKSEYKRQHPLPNQDICSFLFPRWNSFANREAFECLTTGRKMTYGQLITSSLRFGGALKNLNLNSEPDFEAISPKKEAKIPPRITIFAPNVIEYAPVIFGTIAAGYCLTTINPLYKVEEIMYNLRDTKPQLLVVDSSCESRADEALARLKMNIPIMTIGQSSKQGRPNLQEILKDSRIEKVVPKEAELSDVAVILYSGGTSGLPKGVAITHKGLVNNVDCLTDPRIFPFGLTFNPHQTVIGITPFFHIYGFYALMFSQLSLGSKILIFREFDKNTFGPTIKAHKLQYLHIVPTLMNFIINSDEITTEDLSTVQGIIIAANPVSPSSARILQQKIGHEIKFQEGFGMTETLGVNLTPANSVRIGYCGKLLPDTEAKIVDPSTNELCGPGQTGELLVRGTGIMSHYLNNPKATAETIDEEGYLHTGDAVESTDDGYFKIVDRIKELIKVKEFQVYPAEIEDLLMSHPAVSEAGVIGILHERKSEIPRAYVTLKGKVTEEELKELVKRNLAPYKALEGGVVFVENLPKSAAGKILRRDLRTMAREEVKK